MNKILVIAWREFLETVKTRAFFFGVILMPGLIIGIIFGSQRLSEMSEKESVPTRILAVLDQHGAVFPQLQEQVKKFNAQNPQRPFELTTMPPDLEKNVAARLEKGEWYAAITIPAEAVIRDGQCELLRKDEQLSAGRTISDMINDAIVNARMLTADPPIDPRVIAMLQRPVRIAQINTKTGEKSKDSEMARVLTPFIFMFLLYMGTFGISMGLLTSVLEEKSSRVVEVLLAAISPMQLMAGKILGMAAVGVVVLGIWVAVGYSGARAQHMEHMVTGLRLTYVGLYFVPAFLLMSALLAGIGAACNTLKEAQSMISPLSILNILPMVLWFQLSQFPNSALSLVLSFIPPITPFVMILRICADPDIPIWQIVATLVLMWAAVFIAIWAAAKVFRIGVLMYGKPPSIRELIHWVRFA